MFQSTDGLLQFVRFKQGASLFKIDDHSIHGHLVFTCICRNGGYVLNTMILKPERLYEKIDINHALQSTRAFSYVFRNSISFETLKLFRS